MSSSGRGSEESNSRTGKDSQSSWEKFKSMQNDKDRRRTRDRDSGYRDSERNRDRRDRDRDRYREKDRERERDRDRNRDRDQYRESSRYSQSTSSSRRKRANSRSPPPSSSKRLKSDNDQLRSSNFKHSTYESTNGSRSSKKEEEAGSNSSRSVEEKRKRVQEFLRKKREQKEAEETGKLANATNTHTNNQPANNQRKEGLGLNTAIHPLLLETMGMSSAALDQAAQQVEEQKIKEQREKERRMAKQREYERETEKEKEKYQHKPHDSQGSSSKSTSRDSWKRDIKKDFDFSDDEDEEKAKKPRVEEEKAIKKPTTLDLLLKAQQQLEKDKKNPYLADLLAHEKLQSTSQDTKRQSRNINNNAADFDFDSSLDIAAPKKKLLLFERPVEPGSYIRKAEVVRQKFIKEQEKKAAEEAARKKQEQDAIERQRKEDSTLTKPVDGIVGERDIKPDIPPMVEWWDHALVQDLQEQKQEQSNSDNKKFERMSYSLVEGDVYPQSITFYIQHPVLIPPPGSDAPIPALRLHLTKRETKRLRKNARSERLKEKQDRIRLGLDPAPPPKVKLTNLMSVLTNEAISNPTAVEARVRADVAERKQVHEQTNHDRKLTKEERKEKIIAKEIRHRTEHGTYLAVFKTTCVLADPKQRYKIGRNAQQLLLGGIAVSTRGQDGFAIVAVQGSETAVGRFKRLMLNRIKWTEAAPPKDEEMSDAQDEFDDVEGSNDEDDKNDGKKKKKKSKQALQEPVDISSNKCLLIWSGPVDLDNIKKTIDSVNHNNKAVSENNSSFGTVQSIASTSTKVIKMNKWMGINDVDSELDAKDLLAKFGYDSFWVLAHSMK